MVKHVYIMWNAGKKNAYVVLTREGASYTIIGALRVESEGRGAKSEPSVIGKLHPTVFRPGHLSDFTGSGQGQ